MSNQPEARQSKPSDTGMISKFLWVPLCLTLIVGLLLLSMEGPRLSHAGRQFVVSFIYSVLIGFPSIVLLTRVSVFYTERFPRLILLFQALILTATTAFGCLTGGLLMRWIGYTQPGFYLREFWTTFPFSLLIALVSGLGISAYETLRYRLQAAVLELRTREVERERAYKLLAEARLSSLESRIHPHFLFNTLNSIASLIPGNPERAEAMVGRLASLLRFSLNANQSGLVPLSQELKIVYDYLEIERARFGSRLRYEVVVQISIESALLPPLSLQSLVENCVKHVVANRQEGGMIRIHGSLMGGNMLLEVSDDGPGFDLASISPDHGLANLMARMNLLFGEAGYLDVTQTDGHNKVCLHFPVLPRD